MKLWLKVCIHLLLMLVTLLFLFWLATLWLDSWTGHGEYKVVPSVEGLAYQDACETLARDNFAVEISDSVYDDRVHPGMVVGQVPKEGAKVKEGRTVYVTVNAFSPRAVSVPSLVDMSQRQAVSILESLGFKHIKVVEVPSEFRDLVISVSYDGKPLTAGLRIPVTAKMVVEVGAGLPEEDEQEIMVDPDSVDFVIPVSSLDLVE